MLNLIVANYKKKDIVRFGSCKNGIILLDVQKALKMLATEPGISKLQVMMYSKYSKP
jgi:hypothetical protein